MHISDEDAFNQCVAEIPISKVNIFAIKKKEDGSCVFLTADNNCSIHLFKPRVCSFYPCPAYLKEDKDLWERLYFESAPFSVFWEHSIAEYYTKEYVTRFGTTWNEEGYFELLDEIECRVIVNSEESLIVSRDEKGLPIMMKYNCTQCSEKECTMETEITLLDIERIATNTKTPVPSVFKKAIDKHPHSYTGGLKLRKINGGNRCIYLLEGKRCAIYNFRPRFCQFEPCKLKVSDDKTWKCFFFASGELDEQWELEAAAAISRKYVKEVGIKYQEFPFHRHMREIKSLLKNMDLKTTYINNINHYRYDRCPIQPILKS
jgi:Fe-S-cluster containining protein